MSVKHKDDDTDKNIFFLSDISDGKYETMGSRSNKVSSLYLHLTSKKNSNFLAWHLHTESERKPFFKNVFKIYFLFLKITKNQKKLKNRNTEMFLFFYQNCTQQRK